MCECVPIHSSCLKVTFKDVNSSVAAELERNVSIRLEILGVSSRLCLPCFCRNLSMVELCAWSKNSFVMSATLWCLLYFPGAQSNGPRLVGKPITKVQLCNLFSPAPPYLHTAAKSTLLCPSHPRAQAHPRDSQFPSKSVIVRAYGQPLKL